jgi:hypothetical protein
MVSGGIGTAQGVRATSLERGQREKSLKRDERARTEAS